METKSPPPSPSPDFHTHRTSDPETPTSPILESTISSDPLTIHFSSLNDLAHELASLQDLANRGSWRSISDKVSRARNLSLLQNPHDHLTHLSYNVLALTKLRRFSEALAELDSLEDLDSSQYRYESYPTLYPNRTGSMVPFSLRWLHALIPIKMGERQEGLDRFYQLLDFVKSKLNDKEGKNLDGSVDLWKRREVFVVNCIIGHHLSTKEFGVCLSLIHNLLTRDFSDPAMISKLGYIQMYVGDIDGAKRSFDLIEEMVKEGKCNGVLSEVEIKNLVNRNRAFVFLMGKDYESAVKEYEECIERDGMDVVAINNKAICLMYLRDLANSIKVLENALERVPAVALNETVVVNLCSMYELAYFNHSEIKRTLNNWISRVAPDDFDSSSTRI